MGHTRDHIIIHKLSQQVTFNDNGKPGWLKVYHLLAVPAVVGLVLGLLL
jgi:hypothetical protein